MTSRAARPHRLDVVSSVSRELIRLALMAVCLGQAWVIVFVVRIGPVIATVDAERGMGVHSGDLLAFPLVVMAMVLGTDLLVPHPARSASASAGWDHPLVRAH